MVREYKTIDTSTLKGFQEAEKLKEKGWKLVRAGLFNLYFERVAK